VSSDVPAASVRRVLGRAGGDLIGEVALFDVFEGSPLPEGRKSLAFSVEFRSRDRTLTDPEVGAAVSAIVARVAEELGGELRAG
jgi:phenylalanyl-tRNA synthetase beta chain